MSLDDDSVLRLGEPRAEVGVTAVLIAKCIFRAETKFAYGDKTDCGRTSLDMARVRKDLGLSHDLRQRLCYAHHFREFQALVDLD